MVVSKAGKQVNEHRSEAKMVLRKATEFLNRAKSNHIGILCASNSTVEAPEMSLFTSVSLQNSGREK